MARWRSVVRTAVFRARAAYHLGRALLSAEAWSSAAAPVEITAAEAQTPGSTAQPAPLRERVLGVVEEFGPARVAGWVTVPVNEPPVTVTLQARKLEVARTEALPREEFHRNSWSQVRRFSFTLDQVWDYLAPHDWLTVRVDDRLLPITGRGVYRRPGAAGPHTLDDLAERLAAGWRFTVDGALAPPA